MMERLVLWRGVFYEGSDRTVHAIRPVPVISAAESEFIPDNGTRKLVFREDNFDPVTRIRRGRLYLGGSNVHRWGQVAVDDSGHPYTQYNWENLPPEATYEPWRPGANPGRIAGCSIRIGSVGFETNWRIVGAEKLTIGHILLTLRATSLLGVISELAEMIVDKDGSPVDATPVKRALDAVVDAFHRQQAIPTVDVCRETARVILTAWIGEEANTLDLGKLIKKIPEHMTFVRSAAHIVNWLHPRGKSAQQENEAKSGRTLRPVIDEDAEISVQLIGLILREIGWAAS